MATTVEYTDDIESLSLAVTDVSTDNLTDVPQCTDDGSVSGVDDRDVRIIYVTIGCIGVSGNTFVILVMLLKRKLLSRIANTFILNQSVIDVVGSLFMVAFSAPKIDGEFVYIGLGGSVLCKMVQSTTTLFALFTTSTYNILALTVERYMKIVHPFVYKASMTHQKAVAVIATTWVLCPIYVNSIGLPTSEVINGVCITLGVYPNQDVQQFVGILNVIVMFFFPLACIVYLYSHMLYVLHQRSRIAPMVFGIPVAGQVNMGKAQRNLLKTVFLVTLSFVICWSTNQFYFLLINCGYDLGFTSPFYHFTIIMVFANCCINPFLYMLKYLEFQQAVKELFCGASQKQSSNPAVYAPNEATPNKLAGRRNHKKTLSI